MVDWQERVEFILNVQRQYLEACHRQGRDSLRSQAPTTESISFLLSRMQTYRRRVANYNMRTSIRINMFSHLATQADSKVNLQIASTSQKIAEESRRDSLSMITIAAVTMTFLPGTFVTVRVRLGSLSRLTESSQKKKFAGILPPQTNIQLLQGFFSMVFFYTATDQNNSTQIVVSRKIWLYPLVTIPLTIAVMGIWIMWRKQRGKKKGILSNDRKENASE